MIAHIRDGKRDYTEPTPMGSASPPTNAANLSKNCPASALAVELIQSATKLGELAHHLCFGGVSKNGSPRRLQQRDVRTAFGRPGGAATALTHDRVAERGIDVGEFDPALEASLDGPTLSETVAFISWSETLSRPRSPGCMSAAPRDDLERPMSSSAKRQCGVHP